MSDENANKDQPVTISAPPAAPVTIDPQNPLPEPSFFWRRVIACAIAAFALTLAWFTAERLYAMQDAGRLYDLTRLVLLGAGLILTYYFIAPSASELTAMIQTARLQRTVAGKALDHAQERAEPWQRGRFQRPVARDTGFPEKPLSDAYREPSDDLTDLEQDYAPRGRQ